MLATNGKLQDFYWVPEQVQVFLNTGHRHRDFYLSLIEDKKGLDHFPQLTEEEVHKIDRRHRMYSMIESVKWELNNKKITEPSSSFISEIKAYYNETGEIPDNLYGHYGPFTNLKVWPNDFLEWTLEVFAAGKVQRAIMVSLAGLENNSDKILKVYAEGLRSDDPNVRDSAVSILRYRKDLPRDFWEQLAVTLMSNAEGVAEDALRLIAYTDGHHQNMPDDVVKLARARFKAIATPKLLERARNFMNADCSAILSSPVPERTVKSALELKVF